MSQGLIVDATGTYNGVLNNIANSNGKIGQSLLFDGVAGYISFAAPSYTAYTTTTWIKLHTSPTNSICIMTNRFNTNLPSIEVSVNNSLVLTTTATNAYISPTIIFTNTAVSALTLNTWYHVATSYDGTTSKIYINGILNNTVTVVPSVTTTVQPNTYQFHIGCSQVIGGTGNQFMDGEIDDFRYYNRALYDAEVKQLYLEAY